jgi:hypothetical protein
MIHQQSTWIGIQLEGTDRTFWALPRPEDDGRLAELLDRDSVAVSLADDGDVEGHTQSTDVTLDIEGHAMTLRMPTIADAASFRRGLAVGVVTATIVVGGAAAAIQGGLAPTSVEQAPAAPAAPASVEQPIHPQHRTELLNPVAPAAPIVTNDRVLNHPQHQTELLNPVAPAAPIVTNDRVLNHPQHQTELLNPVAPAAPAAPAAPTTVDQGSQRTINSVYNVDTVDVVAPAAPAQAAPGMSDPSAGDSSVPRAGQRPEPR